MPKVSVERRAAFKRKQLPASVYDLIDLLDDLTAAEARAEQMEKERNTAEAERDENDQGWQEAEVHRALAEARAEKAEREFRTAEMGRKVFEEQLNSKIDDLRHNAAMLAKQCDLARTAERERDSARQRVAELERERAVFKRDTAISKHTVSSCDDSCGTDCAFTVCLCRCHYEAQAAVMNEPKQSDVEALRAAALRLCNDTRHDHVFRPGCHGAFEHCDTPACVAAREVLALCGEEKE